MKLNKDSETLDEVVHLIQYAFLKKNDLKKDINFMSRYEHSDGYGTFHDGKLASYIMSNHFESKIFDQEVKMSGIGYVSSYPENRGHGDGILMKQEFLYPIWHHGQKHFIVSMAMKTQFIKKDTV